MTGRFGGGKGVKSRPWMAMAIEYALLALLLAVLIILAFRLSSHA